MSVLAIPDDMQDHATLCAMPSPSGFEGKKMGLMLERWTPHGWEVGSDPMHNCWAIKRPSGESKGTVLIGGHTDTLGGTAKLASEGKRRWSFMAPLGGIYSPSLHGVLVRIHVNEDNFDDVVLGVVNVPEIHLMPSEARSKIVEMKDITITIDPSEIDRIGVGNAISFVTTPTMLGPDFLASRFHDNSHGCDVLLHLAKELAEVDLPYTVVLVAATQEELGVRGAKTVTGALSRMGLFPDVAIAYDATASGDSHGVPGHEQRGEVGKGMVIKIADRGARSTPQLVALAKRAAREGGKEIPFQLFNADTGGTDLAGYQAAGVTAGLNLGIGLRNIHGHEVCSVTDARHSRLHAVQLLTFGPFADFVAQCAA